MLETVQPLLTLINVYFTRVISIIVFVARTALQKKNVN